MQNANLPQTLRRSSRVPAAVPILVTSMDGEHFSEVCETLVVNAHGCAMLSRVKLDSGIPLHFHSKDGRETTAQVVSCQPIDHRSWRLSARLDQPENFWGLKEYPKDWAIPAGSQARKMVQVLPPPGPVSSHKVPAPAAQPSPAELDRLARQLETQVGKMIGESLRPLQAEVSALKEQLAQRKANPSRFEVSLSSIPPELEQQIEQRLRKELGPRMLEDGRQQCSQILAAAKATIDQKTSEGYENFLRRISDQMQVSEKRAHEVSAQISEKTTQHLRNGLEDFHQKLLEGGSSLKRLSEELLEYLQQNINEEYEARRGDLEQFRAQVKTESGRLHEHIEYIDVRIRKLEEAARGLEAGLDQRLSQMSSHTIKETRTQLEAVANEVLEELNGRVVKAVSDQLDEATGKMTIVQKGILASVSESVKQQAATALQSFEHSMDAVAQVSVDRWRQRLAGGLNALAKSLGEKFQFGDEIQR
jgi:hypothetical protein